MAWLVLSEFLVVPVYVRWLDMSWLEALMQSLLYAGFSGFVFVTSLVARQQAQAREEQRRLNAELRATRALLAESARINERTRISRELHDLLGHHLTALSLNLEVAGHLAEGKAQEHVNQAHTLAKLLLSDVREAVSRLRDEDSIDMAATLLPLADHVAGTGDRDGNAAAVPARRSRARARAAALHAGDHHQRRPACAGASTAPELSAGRPDGPRCRRAMTAAAPKSRRAGNGLRGMRERLAAYGGRVDIVTAPGRGFALDIALPLDDGVIAGRAPALTCRSAIGPAEASVGIEVSRAAIARATASDIVPWRGCMIRSVWSTIKPGAPGHPVAAGAGRGHRGGRRSRRRQAGASS